MLVNLLHVDSTERPPRCRDSGDKYRQVESPLDTWQFLWQTSDVRCNVECGCNKCKIEEVVVVGFNNDRQKTTRGSRSQMSDKETIKFENLIARDVTIMISQF